MTEAPPPGSPDDDFVFDGGAFASPPAPSDPTADLELSIKSASAKPGNQPGEMHVELETTRGPLEMYLQPREGKTGCAIFIGGAGGGVDGPANKVYVRLSQSLLELGVTSLRVMYRKPGEFQECVLDALAACSFLKGLGAERAVMVGHSFGGAVAIKAGELGGLVNSVVAMSSQRFGTQDVDKLGRPLLLIHGSQDDVLDRAASDDIHSRAKDPKHLVILEGAGHGLAEAADDVFGILEDFISRQVGDGPRS
ncbi:MAG: alpha/beta hydrolase [Dehalococcoidia bacterium]|nr:alpha/beta hydrolase [Dehalococcoidia bacterium]